MKITADNRGRISLGQLRAGYSKNDTVDAGVPYSEWDVTVENGQVLLKPHGKAPGDGWVKYDLLLPRMIGSVVRVRGLLGYTESKNGAVLVPEFDVEQEVVGVLEAYCSMAGNEWMRLKGMTQLIRLDSKEQRGNSYGSGISFYIRETA